MLKILVVTTVSRTVNAFLGPHILALKQAGHVVDIACAIDQDVDHDIQSACGSVIALPMSRSPLRFSNVISVWKLFRRCRSTEYDVVHGHTPVGGAVGRIAARLGRVPYVVYTAHGLHFYRGSSLVSWGALFPVEWVLSFITDYFLTINAEDYILARRFFRHPSVRLTPGVGIQQPEAVDTCSLTMLEEDVGLQPESKFLLSVGELNANKGHELAIRALAQLSRDFHYVVAGEGDQREKLLTLAADLGVADRVHLLGFRKDISALMRRADMLLHPSHREGLCTAVLEAMSVGLPVVASDIRGVRDVVTLDSGLLLDVRSPQLWANSVMEVLERLSELRGGRAATLRFSESQAVAATVNLYNEIDSCSRASTG